ncbi:MAG TPA: exonuclease domain-containing protein [Candidatus Rifleibacterium sp.]|jgi:DNA polymerase III epsilon subunit family exonuclease|nr:exonuclease domain-containing protein [Candidatus Rifleibacterium sp.]HPW58493.1 exonuclease domain-containing protein [Candidatus Rifleibacterium sp.]
MPEFINRPLKDLPFVILDLETTGFKPEEAGITEIAIITMKDGKEETFETLVDPEMAVPAEITRITGITNDMVRGQPKMAELLPFIQELFRDKIFVAHNVPFDWSFFDYAYRKHLRQPLKMPSLCTLRLARKYLGLQSNKLESVAKYFNVSLVGAHRAMNDTRAVKDILFGLIDQLERRGIKTGADLYNQSLIFPEVPPAR